MCSVGRECTGLRTCVCVFVGSVRDDTGGGYPCDSQQVERLWIKGHVHPLYRKAAMMCVILFSHLANDAFASSVLMSNI